MGFESSIIIIFERWAVLAAAKDLGLRGDEAKRVRKRVGTVARKALAKLAEELELYKPIPAKRLRRKVDLEDITINGVPLDWVERFVKIADQLRRDYVIDEAPAQAGDSPAKPVGNLRGLRIASGE